MSLSLPAPAEEARAHSARLAEHVAGEIELAGGWIPFSRYMELALYAPGLGYYAAGARKLGADGDFVTAPEMTPLFAQTLASQFAQVIEATGGDVLELGAGTGSFAADALAELDRLGALPRRYYLLETSPELRARQKVRVDSLGQRLTRRVEWLESLPERFAGLVFGNEVLDAVPCEIVRRHAGGWLRRGVGAERGGALAWVDRALDDARLLAAAQARLPEVDDYVTEINPAAEALVRTLATRLERGGILLVDYGFPAAEYFHPQRSAGTLMCHYRHRAHDDPFFLPGLQDITAHVDFTAIARAAVDAGAALAGYTTLAHFLVNLGIADRVLAAGEPGTADYLRRAAPVQKLLSPAEMGELFKVVAFGRSLDADWKGFRSGDQSHRL